MSKLPSWKTYVVKTHLGYKYTIRARSTREFVAKVLDRWGRLLYEPDAKGFSSGAKIGTLEELIKGLQGTTLNMGNL